MVEVGEIYINKQTGFQYRVVKTNLATFSYIPVHYMRPINACFTHGFSIDEQEIKNNMMLCPLHLQKVLQSE